MTSQKTNIFLGFFIALFFATIQTYGQSDCVVTLRDAQKLFESGLIEKVPEKLNPCIRRGFNKTEKIQAYKLMILCYLYDDHKHKADSLMLKLLKIEPEFKTSPQIDPSEFIALYNSYRTLPTYTIGINAGLSFSDVDMMRSYGVHNEILEPGKYKPSSVGYHVGFDVSRYLLTRLEAKIGIGLVTNKYENNNKMLDNEYTITTFKETQSRLDIPLAVSVDILKNDIKPYVSLGLCGGYMVNSKTEISRTIKNNPQNNEKTIDIKEYRNPMNLWAVYGTGVKYKVESGHITFNINYNRGLFNQVKTDARYANPEFIYSYYHIDDDYKLNFWSFSFGYTYSFFKPKKKR